MPGYPDRDKFWDGVVKRLFSRKTHYAKVADSHFDKILGALKNTDPQWGMKVLHIGVGIPCLIAAESLVGNLDIVVIEPDKTTIIFEEECFRYYSRLRELKTRKVRFIRSSVEDFCSRTMYRSLFGYFDIVTMFDLLRNQEEASRRKIVNAALNLIKIGGTIWLPRSMDGCQQLLLEEVEKRGKQGIRAELNPEKLMRIAPEFNVAYLIKREFTPLKKANYQQYPW